MQHIIKLDAKDIKGILAEYFDIPEPSVKLEVKEEPQGVMEDYTLPVITATINLKDKIYDRER